MKLSVVSNRKSPALVVVSFKLCCNVLSATSFSFHISSLCGGNLTKTFTFFSNKLYTQCFIFFQANIRGCWLHVLYFTSIFMLAACATFMF